MPAAPVTAPPLLTARGVMASTIGASRQPHAIAHRGASAAAPENTLPAYHAAWASGCGWIEADVQPTSDNVPMMLHDHDLDRTTSGCGPIRDVEAQRVRALDAGSWFGPGSADPVVNPTVDATDRGTDLTDPSRYGTVPYLQGAPPYPPDPYRHVTVPYLAEVVANLSPTRALLLEIKGEHTPEQVAAELAVLKASRWNQRVLVESFEVEVLRHVQFLDPGRPVGLLVQDLHADPVAVCAELGAVAYNPDHRQLRERPEVVDALHAAGVAVMAYTVDEAEDWAFLTELGVDGIITNLPTELLAWQQAQLS